MGEEFNNALKTVAKKIFDLDKIINKKIKYSDQLMVFVNKYIELSENMDAMFESVRAEIQAKGRANKRTVLGKNTDFFNKVERGMTLKDYYYKKISLIRDMHTVLLRLINEINLENRVDSSSFKLLFDSIDSIKTKRRGEAKKTEKLIKLSERIDKELLNLNKLNSKNVKVISKDAKVLKVLYHDSVYQSSKLKGLCYVFFAKSNFNRLIKRIFKERKRFYKSIKNISVFLKILRLNLVKLIELLNDVVDELSVIGGKDTRIVSLVDNIRQDLKHVKKLKKLVNKDKKFEKSLKKLSKLKNFGEEKDVDDLEKELEKEDSELKLIDDEEERITNLIKTLEGINNYLSKILDYAFTLSQKFSSNINYLTNSLIEFPAIVKKSSADAELFVNKLQEYAKKTVIKTLSELEKKETELSDEFNKEHNSIMDLLNDFNNFLKSDNKLFNRSLNHIFRAVKSLNKDLLKEFENTKKEIIKSEKTASKDHKINKKIRKNTLKAGLNINKSEIHDIIKKERNFRKELDEENELIVKLNKDTSIVYSAINDLKNVLPDFKSISKKIINKKSFNKLFKELNSDNTTQDFSFSIDLFNQWIEEPFNLKIYVDFLDSLTKRFNNEFKFFNLVASTYNKVYVEETEINEFFVSLTNSFNALKELDKALGVFEQDFSNYFDGSELFSKIRVEYDYCEQELESIKKIEALIDMLKKSDYMFMNRVKRYNSLIQSFNEHVVSYAKKRIKPINYSET